MKINSTHQRTISTSMVLPAQSCMYHASKLMATTSCLYRVAIVARSPNGVSQYGRWSKDPNRNVGPANGRVSFFAHSRISLNSS